MEVYDFAISQGFQHSDAIQFQSAVQVLALKNFPDVVQNMQQALQIHSSATYTIMEAGLKNFAEALLFTQEPQVWAYKSGYPVADAITYTNNFQVLGCIYTNTDVNCRNQISPISTTSEGIVVSPIQCLKANDVPSCMNVNSALHVKALKWHVPLDIALTITNIFQISALISGLVTPTDAMRFNNAWQVKYFLESKGIDLEQSLLKPTDSDLLSAQLGVVDSTSQLLLTYNCYTTPDTGLTICLSGAMSVSLDGTPL